MSLRFLVYTFFLLIFVQIVGYVILLFYISFKDILPKEIIKKYSISSHLKYIMPFNSSWKKDIDKKDIQYFESYIKIRNNYIKFLLLIFALELVVILGIYNYSAWFR